ncbi:hypothetical protein HNR46_002794 [Haloferula luteola]|uniref:Uncharacterized protein n=1 Tax=Haloferula luteola TaxID=595692 RepID=A0A840VD45_9BACT|nr:hypothetical protein [Haloferula luteola]MBB5352548.1 hypothetical protein [Haloferula luteola]
MKIRSLLFLLLSLLVLPCLADPYKAGETIEVFSAKDQHQKAYTLEPKNTRYLLVSHDMETGKAANKVLDGLGADYLPGKKAIYMANIHGMPGIGRMFALPKMRKYAHRIILGDDAELIAHFPQQAGKVTVLKLSGKKIVSIQYWDPAKEAPGTYLP